MKNHDRFEGFGLLGNEVVVIVDRPLNSCHPEHGFKYELNYGYIPGTLAGDGEEVDAYILGVDFPVTEFKGIVKGLIIRINDVENKLVVTPPDYSLTKGEVECKTKFQEQFFKTNVVLCKE